MTNAQWLAGIGAYYERSVFVKEEAGKRFAIDDAQTAALMAWLWPADEMAAALCLRAAELYLAANMPEHAERFARMGLACKSPGHITGRLHMIKARRVEGGSGRILYQIGNNKGHVNGWTSRENIFGVVTEVEP